MKNIIISLAICLVGCNTSNTDKKDVLENNKDSETKAAFVDQAILKNDRFIEYVNRFKKKDLPFDLISTRDWKFDDSSTNEIDTSIVHSFICKGTIDCMRQSDGGYILYYYVCNLPASGNYSILVHFSTVGHYVLSTYSLEGNIIGSIEFSGQIGGLGTDEEASQIDGRIDKNYNVQVKKTFSKVDPANPEYVVDARDEEFIYQIQSDGKIKLISSKKGNERKGQFKEDGTLEDIVKKI